MDAFKTLIDDYTAEHTAAEGGVTCEFATKHEDIEAKKAVLAAAGVLTGYRWVIHECSTCVEYHGPNHVHVQIVNLKFWGKDPIAGRVM